MENNTPALHKDLVRYVEKHANGVTMLRHPLYYAVPYFKGENEMINQRYSFKKKYVAKLLQQGKYHEYTFMHEKPYRLDAFMKIMDLLTPKEYWSILSDVWSNSENIFSNLYHWETLLEAKIPHRHYFMTVEDKAYLDSLPETFKVYRGCIKDTNEHGYSYTLDIKVAEFFSKRIATVNNDRIIIEKKVNKSQVFAYISCRNEKEVIIK